MERPSDASAKPIATAERSARHAASRPRSRNRPTEVPKGYCSEPRRPTLLREVSQFPGKTRDSMTRSIRMSCPPRLPLPGRTGCHTERSTLPRRFRATKRPERLVGRCDTTCESPSGANHRIYHGAPTARHRPWLSVSARSARSCNDFGGRAERFAKRQCVMACTSKRGWSARARS